MNQFFLLKGFVLLLIISLCGKVSAQCFNNRPDTVINLNCQVNCTDLNFRIPDLKQTTDYRVVTIPYAPLPFSDSRIPKVDFTSGTAWPGNSYSRLIDLPFKFCFFDSSYNSLAVGANGVITFDSSMAGKWCEPRIKFQTNHFRLPANAYARALIAGAMSDYDPLDTGRVSGNVKVEFRIEGTAPCRRAVFSYSEIPLWPGLTRTCHLQPTNTSQIVLYESTNVIDVFVKDHVPCLGSNEGYSTMGIQNWDRNYAVADRNHNGERWGGIGLNEGWRFEPNGGSSLLISADLYLNGTQLVGSGVITPTGTGELDVSFPNICPPVNNNFYVLRAVYIDCDGGGTFEITDTAWVNKTNSLAATAEVQPAACASNTGSITMVVPAGLGTPPFTYSIGGPVQSSNVFSNLAPGNYSVVVSDAGNCSSTVNVNVPTFNPLAVSFDITDASCNGSSDGSITVIAVRGAEPYQYSFNGGPFQSNNVFGNLSPGTYVFTVRDANGCIRTNLRATVIPGPPLTSTFTVVDVLCFGGSNGTITMNTPTFGTPPFSYSIDGGTFQTSNVFANITAGNYNIFLRDNGGCTGQVFVRVREPEALFASSTVTPVRCNGESNGRIDVIGFGGTSPYQFSIDGINFQASNTFTVAAGTYTITIRDANNCITTTRASVTQPIVLTATATSVNATCNGGPDGKITVSATGGNGNYEYSSDGVNFQSSNVLNVPPGNFTVVVRDQRTCSFSFNINVGMTNDLVITPTQDAEICEGTSVVLSVNSNAEQYAWTPSTGLNNPSIPNPSASPAVSTEYVVTATYGRCVTTDTIFVAVKQAPVANAGIDGNICTDSSFVLQGSGGIAYQWSPSTSLDDAQLQYPTATPDVTTQYSLHVTGVNGCRSITPDLVDVFVTPPVVITVSPIDTIVSVGDQVMVRAVSGATSYVWSPVTGLSDSRIANPIATVNTSIQYKVYGTTSAGCSGEATVNIKVYKGPDLYVPTAFSPNRNGKNDIFKPFPVGIKELKYFRIYNRWGQLVYSTKTLNAGWDGRLGGRDESPGVYVWMVQGVTKDDKIITKRGTVTLVR